MSFAHKLPPWGSGRAPRAAGRKASFPSHRPGKLAQNRRANEVGRCLGKVDKWRRIGLNGILGKGESWGLSSGNFSVAKKTSTRLGEKSLKSPCVLGNATSPPAW